MHFTVHFGTTTTPFRPDFQTKVKQQCFRLFVKSGFFPTWGSYKCLKKCSERRTEVAGIM
jgi:hypothetical protein